jgi:hypothetical protein
MHLNKTGGTQIVYFYKLHQRVKQIFGGIGL